MPRKPAKKPAPKAPPRGTKFSSAKVTFYVVPHGWQADVEVHPGRGEPRTGSVCRDWGDDGPSAKAFLEKLMRMAETGEP